MADFDVKALHGALDAEREARGLTWAALSREITGSEPGAISSSSFSRMGKRAAVNGNVVMAALRWLDRTPESFMPDHQDTATSPGLPRNLPRRFFGRWNLEALHAALETRRSALHLTWAEVADEIGVRPALLASYAKHDTLVVFPSIMRVTCWLDRPLTDFIDREESARRVRLAGQ